MMNTNENLQFPRKETPLPKPSLLLYSLPLETKLIKAISEARETITRIIQGLDTRLLVIVGPCSLHEEEAALEYAERLKEAAECYS
ncbi:MAG TPA: 3-deoxy-7-phosphoheptulonate synthase, partial [Gammaproteobacteria bacterium]|nr:3-deoxy-7-phosphoheptulonate synthase [Gammaproteobacteria bacterium]